MSKVTTTKCPIDISVQILANKWTIPIIRELMSGPKRPSDLERTLKGLSAKTLAERLHDLQAWGIVSRQSHPEVPPRVEYSLTELGRELETVLETLKKYGCRWQQEMKEETYDLEVCEQCPETNECCPAVKDLSVKENPKERMIRTKEFRAKNLELPADTSCA